MADGTNTDHQLTSNMNSDACPEDKPGKGASSVQFSEKVCGGLTQDESENIGAESNTQDNGKLSQVPGECETISLPSQQGLDHAKIEQVRQVNDNIDSSQICDHGEISMQTDVVHSPNINQDITNHRTENGEMSTVREPEILGGDGIANTEIQNKQKVDAASDVVSSCSNENKSVLMPIKGVGQGLVHEECETEMQDVTLETNSISTLQKTNSEPYKESTKIPDNGINGESGQDQHHLDYRPTAVSHDSDSSSVSSEESSPELSSGEGDDEDEEVIMPNRASKKDIRTKGELSLDELPPIEDLHITVSDSIPMWYLGVVGGIVGVLVVVHAKPDTPALDADTILFKEDRTPIGKVFETFGPVSSPYYSVRFNSSEDIEEKQITTGMQIFYVPTVEEWTHFVFLAQLKKLRGSDASWENNNEPPDKFLDFSDDEEERRFKAKNRMKKISQEGDDSTEVETKKAKPRRQKHRQKFPIDADQDGGNSWGNQGHSRGFNEWPPPGPTPFGPGPEEIMGIPPIGNGHPRPRRGINQGPGEFMRGGPRWPGPRPCSNPWAEPGYRHGPRGPMQGPPPFSRHHHPSNSFHSSQATSNSKQHSVNSSNPMMMDMRFVQSKTHASESSSENQMKGPHFSIGESEGLPLSTPPLGQGPPVGHRPPVRGSHQPQPGPPRPMGPRLQGHPPGSRLQGPAPPHGSRPMGPPWNRRPGPHSLGGPRGPPPRSPMGHPPAGMDPQIFHRFGGRPNFPQGPQHNWNFN